MAAAKNERADALRFIVCLGVVSLFADMTYEGAYSIIGPFLQGLGATAAEVGLISGAGQMIAASLRYFSGKLADRARAYWTLTTLGYLLTLAAVPALAFAGNWKIAALLVVAERTGKSLRGPARDVLLSEATGIVGHGWGFGLHTAMDQTGAVLGPLLVVAAVARSQHFGPAFLHLAIPAVGAMGALLIARAFYPQGGLVVAEHQTRQARPGFFWMYVAAAAVLACGFVDFPLLAYHFQKTSVVQPVVIPLLYSGAMGVNGLTALFFGRLFDRHGVPILTIGILVSLLALPLGFLGGLAGAIASVICWGAGMGVQDACLRPGIARAVSMNKRGSAFGIFNGIYGVAWFLGSAAMGLLYGRSLLAVVAFGVTLQFAAAVLFFRLRDRIPPDQSS